MRLLLVEDHPAMTQFLSSKLTQSFVVDTVVSGREALNLARTRDYSLMILDVGLPDISGLEVCTKLRQEGCDCPLMMLTAADGVTAKVQGLNAGADDYLAKPFAMPELWARIQALLRRGSHLAGGASISSSRGALQVGALRLDHRSQTVYHESKIIKLCRKEFLILALLMAHAGQVLSKEQIIWQVWPDPELVAANSVEVQLSNLRKKIDKRFGRNYIKTVCGRGYRLEEW